jgi:simple sugar transport system ATP-binding protein
VLLISEDLEELMSVADRIAVMFEGHVIGVLPAEQADREILGLMMAGIEVAEAREPGQTVGTRE